MMCLSAIPPPVVFSMLSREDPRALDQLQRDRFERYAGSLSVSSSDGRRLRLAEAKGSESEAVVPSTELAKGAPDPPLATRMHAPKVTVPLGKVKTAVPIGAAVLLAPMLAIPADATGAALLAFTGGQAVANMPGAPVAVPEAEAAAVVPLLAQPETPPL